MTNQTSPASEFSQGEVDEFMEQTYKHLKDVLKESKEIAKLDEEAIEDFYEAMKVFERERALIQAFAMIPQQELQNAIDEGDAVKVKEIVQQAEQRAGVDDMLDNMEYLQEIKADLQKIEENTEEAFKLLQRADNLIQDEHEHDVDLEESIQKFEGSYIRQLTGTLNALSQATDWDEVEANDGKWAAE